MPSVSVTSVARMLLAQLVRLTFTPGIPASPASCRPLPLLSYQTRSPTLACRDSNLKSLFGSFGVVLVNGGLYEVGGTGILHDPRSASAVSTFTRYFVVLPASPARATSSPVN